MPLSTLIDSPTADSADQTVDHLINPDDISTPSNSWKLNDAQHDRIFPAGDVNEAGHPGLMIGAPDMHLGTNPDSGGVILLSGAAMGSLDAADGETDGEIMITQARQEGTWKLDGKADSFIELDRIARRWSD